MPLTFRPLTEDDLDATAALWEEGWHAGHAHAVPAELTRLRTRASFRQRLAAHEGETFLSHDGPRLAGFVMLKPDEVYQFYIARDARGTGAAFEQMQEAERRLAASGVCSAWLGCSVGNTRAARFYEKAGWTRAATELHSVDTSEGPFPIEIWRYEKALDPPAP